MTTLKQTTKTRKSQNQKNDDLSGCMMRNWEEKKQSEDLRASEGYLSKMTQSACVCVRQKTQTHYCDQGGLEPVDRAATGGGGWGGGWRGGGAFVTLSCREQLEQLQQTKHVNCPKGWFHSTWCLWSGVIAQWRRSTDANRRRRCCYDLNDKNNM